MPIDPCSRAIVHCLTFWSVQLFLSLRTAAVLLPTRQLPRHATLPGGPRMAPGSAPAAERPPRRGTRRRTPKSNPDFVSTLGFTDEDFDFALEASSVSSGSVDREVAVATQAASTNVSSPKKKTQLDVRDLLKSKKGPLRLGPVESAKKRPAPVETAPVTPTRLHAIPPQNWRTMFPSELPTRKRRRLRYMRDVHPGETVVVRQV